ncbi:MAG: hypothetical protein WC647_02140 [Desulfomonilaceae bacterium]
MTEIRSTIDIMMERTRGMLLSDEEKKRLKNEELQKKAKGYAVKFLEPAGSRQAALSSLNGEPQEYRSLLEKLVWKEIVTKISTEADVNTLFERFEEWPFATSKKSEIESFRTTFKNQVKNKNKDKKTILEREKKKLADAGISGSAVVPKFSKEMETAGLTELIEQFRNALL